jgi:hypothetical protein
MKKLFIIPLIFFLLQSCGYTPIYSKNQTVNFYIESLEFDGGNNELAIFIKTNLQRYLKKNDNKGFKIETIIDYSKNTLSKNSTGEIIDYELIASIEFAVKYKEVDEKFKFLEKFNMNNLNDEFEERQYERIIKQNMARSIVSKLLIQLSRLNDN